MVAIPKIADTHIQKIAPGPPITIAVAAPARLPVPTCAAIAVVSAWKEDIPSLPAFAPFRLMLPNTAFRDLPNSRN